MGLSISANIYYEYPTKLTYVSYFLAVPHVIQRLGIMLPLKNNTAVFLIVADRAFLRPRCPSRRFFQLLRPDLCVVLC